MLLKQTVILYEIYQEQCFIIHIRIIVICTYIEELLKLCYKLTQYEYILSLPVLELSYSDNEKQIYIIC